MEDYAVLYACGRVKPGDPLILLPHQRCTCAMLPSHDYFIFQVSIQYLTGLIVGTELIRHGK